MCSRVGCYKRPHYGNSGGKAIYCVTHKEPAMVNIHGRRCNHEDCDKQPTFGRKGQKALYCSGHREPEMVDVVYKRCEFPGGCEKHPHFGAEGEKARFCGRHKMDGMVNVKHRRCQQPGCRRERRFTDDPNTEPLYCSLHLAYQERGIDLRSCDLDLPPGLTPNSPARRVGSGMGDLAAPMGSMPGAGMLPGLGASQRLPPEMHHRLPPSNSVSAASRKRPRLVFGERFLDEVGEMAQRQLQQRQQHSQRQMHPQQVRQVQAQQQQQQNQQNQHRRLYDVRPHRQIGSSLSPPATAYLPPAPPVPASVTYAARPFGGLGSHGEVGGAFSGMSSYRPGAPGMASGSAFVDAPIPGVSSRVAPMSTVGGGVAIGLPSSSGCLGGNGNGPSGSTSYRSSAHPESPAMAPTSLTWPISGRGGSNVSAGLTAGGTGSPSVAGSNGSSGGDGSGGGGGGGGGVGSSGDNGVGGGGGAGGSGGSELKPPPTEPPVHGPLYQYTSRGMTAGHGPAGIIAPVRLPTLGWAPPASPPLLPGISNLRHLSAAAGAVLSEPGGGGGGVGSTLSSWQGQSYETAPGAGSSASALSPHQHRASTGPEQMAVRQGQQVRTQQQQSAGVGQGAVSAAGAVDQHLLSPGWEPAQVGQGFPAWGGSLEGLSGGGGLDDSGGGHGPRPPRYWVPQSASQARAQQHQRHHQHMISLPDERAPPGRLLASSAGGGVRVPGGGGGHHQLP